MLGGSRLLAPAETTALPCICLRRSCSSTLNAIKKKTTAARAVSHNKRLKIDGSLACMRVEGMPPSNEFCTVVVLQNTLGMLMFLPVFDLNYDWMILIQFYFSTSKL